jgi:hypothetical protein
VNLRLPATLKEAAEKAAAADHRSLTSLVEKLLADHVKTRPLLEDWHERTQARLVGVLADKRPQDLKGGLFTRSYAIETRNAEQLNPISLTRNLQNIHAQLSSLLPSPNFVYPFTRPELTPYFTFDPKLSRGLSEEILECIATGDLVSISEAWRVSPSGLVSDTRNYYEDQKRFQELSHLPDKWFCAFFMTCDLFALVHHAYLFSEKFATGQIVQFRCEWSGLLEREIGDPDPLIHWLPGKMSRVDERTTGGEWPLSDIRGNWPEIVSALGAPVMRLFDPTFDYSADWVRNQTSRFRR